MVPADQSPRPDPEIERLLAEGLELFGRNRIDEAVACWQRVLSLSPGEPRARDYLDAAVPPAKVIPLRHDAPAGDLRLQVQRMIQERRFEDALDVLLAARGQAPNDESIARSIRLLKERLMRQYIERIGNLDRVPRATLGTVHPSSLGAEAQEVLRLIDGATAVDDILLSSRLGQFRTLRTLVTLNERMLISLASGSSASLAPTSDGIVDRVLADETSTVNPMPPEPPPSEVRFTPRAAGAPTTPPPVGERASAPTTPAAPPASIAPAPPARAAAPSPDPYAELFAQATKAYLRRDYAGAEQLFEQCVAQRPDDVRAQHNLESLRHRRSKTTP